MDKNKKISADKWSPWVRVANYHKFKNIDPWKRTNMDPQLILCVRGELVFGYLDLEESPIIRPKAGELLFIEPERKHVIYSGNEDTVISGFHFEPLAGERYCDIKGSLEPLPPTLTKLANQEFDSARQLFVELAEMFGSHLQYRDSCVQTLCHHILLRLSSYWSSGNCERKIDTRIEEMLAYIRLNYKNAISRNTLGSHFGITPEHVNYIFKRELSTTPSKVINRERCIRAYNLLIHQGVSVKEAAYEVGFNDPAYFSRVFRAFMQRAPNDVKSR